MKAVLGCLLCLILTSAQCFALKGGPVFGGGAVRTTGIYAGVLYPVDVVNSIGLFSVTVPRTGLGTGSMYLFANSNAYVGTVQATADPDSAAFTGFLDAGFNFVQTIQTSTDENGNPVFTTQTLRAVASGRIDGKIKATQGFRQTAARLSGQSLIQFNPSFGSPGMLYQLVGFKQSDIL